MNKYINIIIEMYTTFIYIFGYFNKLDREYIILKVNSIKTTKKKKHSGKKFINTNIYTIVLTFHDEFILKNLNSWVIFIESYLITPNIYEKLVS